MRSSAGGRLRSAAPNGAFVVVNLGCLDPGGGLHVGGALLQGCFRVTGTRATAAFPQSQVERLVRRIPGVGRLVGRILRDREAADRARATALLKIDHVAVGNCARPPAQVADLPVAGVDDVVSVRVTNCGDRPLLARVVVEGVIL